VDIAAVPAPNHLPARIVSVRDEGLHAMIELEIEAQRIWAKTRNIEHLPAPGPAFAHLPAHWCALYADGRRLP
jgi:hypothetical protein